MMFGKNKSGDDRGPTQPATEQKPERTFELTLGATVSQRNVPPGLNSHATISIDLSRTVTLQSLSDVEKFTEALAAFIEATAVQFGAVK